jgi:hypothetical protein
MPVMCSDLGPARNSIASPYAEAVGSCPGCSGANRVCVICNRAQLVKYQCSSALERMCSARMEHVWRPVHTWRATSAPIGFALHALVIRGCSGRDMPVSAANMTYTDRV